MTKITHKEVLANRENIRIIKLDIFSLDIAHCVKPGQFVVIMVNERGERIPLTVVNRDEKKGTITLIFQETGLSTRLLGRLNEGDYLYAVAGPLGHATEIKNYGKIILIGGGVGIAEIYPVAEAFKTAGNRLSIVLGARNSNLLILERELKTVSNGLYAVTDDGSYGRKGVVTDVLKELLVGEKTDLVYAVGPVPMMKKVSSLTADFKVKTVVSLNSLMVDASGMCGCCRVTVGGEVKFSCVDGPEFDGNLIDWDEVENRSKIYEKAEKHICHLYNA